MKIIEAMKRIKANKEKIADLQSKIALISANLSHETPVYGDETKNKVKEFAQSCEDCGRENIRLLIAIQKANLSNDVTIELGGRNVTKTISEWIWRRREYAESDLKTWSSMTDRNLREGSAASSTGVPIEVKIVRHYEPELKDKRVAEYKSEPHLIDAALEVKNAVTDILE